MSASDYCILNNGFVNKNEEKDSENYSGKSANEIIDELNKSMMTLKGNFITDEGVDYKRMKSSKEFEKYKIQSGYLKAVDLNSLSQIELKTFFINVYNCLTLHALVEGSDLSTSTIKIEGFWRRNSYQIGKEFIYSLDDIEHGVLRNNVGHPSSGAGKFNESDPRCNFVVKEMDPRIHFALNCGAMSCPPIRIYSSHKLDSQLTTAAISFCSQEVTLNEDGDELMLSKLFLWYKQDFGSNDGELIRTLGKYVKDKVIKEKMEEFSQAPDVSDKIKFRDYNWNLNISS